MPVYNNEKYLSGAIESVLNQTHKNIELLILDDGSTDSSLSIIENYAMHNKNIIKELQTQLMSYLNM